MGLLGNFGTSLTLLLAHLSLFRAHREHKVHNIVLYPDKESWCKTTPIKQVVTWPQCSSQELDNNVCVGACFSYMVPHSEPSAPGDLIRPYCDSCQPLDSIWHTVTLECKDKDDNPTTMQKKVQIITNCSCSSCMESSRIKPDLNSLLASLELGPTAAAVATARPEPASQTQAPVAAAAAVAAVAAAAVEQEQQQQQTATPAATAAPPLQQPPPTAEQTEPPVPQHETPDLLLNPNLNGTRPAGLNANERFLKLFKQINQPGLAQDKLMDKLAKLDGLEKLEKLEKLASEYSGAKELFAKLSELLLKYSSQDEASLGEQSLAEEEPEVEEDEEEPSAIADELQLALRSTSPAPPPPPPEAPSDPDDEEVPSLQDGQLKVAAALLHRTGPHHSMVLDADANVKEKIDVESHYLQPALAGQEISYHDNGLLDKGKNNLQSGLAYHDDNVLLDKTKKKDF